MAAGNCAIPRGRRPPIPQAVPEHRGARHQPGVRVAGLLCLSLVLSGCSIKTMAVKTVADSLSEGTSSFATDDDPQLIKDALPFGLKTLEGLLAQLPARRA